MTTDIQLLLTRIQQRTQFTDLRLIDYDLLLEDTRRLYDLLHAQRATFVHPAAAIMTSMDSPVAEETIPELPKMEGPTTESLAGAEPIPADPDPHIEPDDWITTNQTEADATPDSAPEDSVEPSVFADDDVLGKQPLTPVIESRPVEEHLIIPLSVSTSQRPYTPPTGPDIRKLIGINDKYLFTSELFRNDNAAFEQALQEIQSFESKWDALRWIQNGPATDYHWSEDDSTVTAFFALMDLYFSRR